MYIASRRIFGDRVAAVSLYVSVLQFEHDNRYNNLLKNKTKLCSVDRYHTTFIVRPLYSSLLYCSVRRNQHALHLHHSTQQHTHTYTERDHVYTLWFRAGCPLDENRRVVENAAFDTVRAATLRCDRCNAKIQFCTCDLRRDTASNSRNLQVVKANSLSSFLLSKRVNGG